VGLEEGAGAETAFMMTKTEAWMILFMWSAAFVGMPAVYLVFGPQHFANYVAVYGIVVILILLDYNGQIVEWGKFIKWVLSIPLEAIKVIKE
jgi:hypothetical protein